MVAQKTETYESSGLESFEVQINDTPDSTRHQKRFELLFDSSFPIARGSTRKDLLGDAIGEFAKRLKPNIARAKIVLALCEGDLLCGSDVGEDITGADLAPTVAAIYDDVYTLHETLRALASMAAEGGFTEESPMQKLDVPDTVSLKEWNELGRKLKAAERAVMAKQYARGQAVLSALESNYTKIIASQVTSMELGLSIAASLTDGPERVRGYISKVEAISGEPCELAGRFNELVSTVEAATRNSSQDEGGEP